MLKSDPSQAHRVVVFKPECDVRQLWNPLHAKPLQVSLFGPFKVDLAFRDIRDTPQRKFTQLGRLARRDCRQFILL